MKKFTTAFIIGGLLVAAISSQAAVGFSVSETAPGTDVRASFEADNSLNKTITPMAGRYPNPTTKSFPV